jgi:hypothetical protein
MSKYTFTFKKDNICVEFSTTNKSVIEKQFKIWVNSASAFVEKKSTSSIPRYNEQKLPSVAEFNKKDEYLQEVKEETVKEKYGFVNKEPGVFNKASSLLKTINSMQDPVSENDKNQKPFKAQTNFEDVLGQSIKNPTFEPSKLKDQVFLSLIKSKNTKDKFHYLIITAYYLSEFEKSERFSLKQINAKLMHNLSELIDHSTLQEAINQNFIELVPDLTGEYEVAEYRLTMAGEDFFANRI